MKLKPCPFCGSVAESNDWGVSCSSGKCGLSLTAFHVDEWNTRTDNLLTRLREAVEEIDVTAWTKSYSDMSEFLADIENPEVHCFISAEDVHKILKKHIPELEE